MPKPLHELTDPELIELVGTGGIVYIHAKRAGDNMALRPRSVMNFLEGATPPEMAHMIGTLIGAAICLSMETSKTIYPNDAAMQLAFQSLCRLEASALMARPVDSYSRTHDVPQEPT